MNRIKLSPLSQLGFSSPKVKKLAELRKPQPSRTVAFDDHVHDLFDYTLFIPQHYEAKYAYPLLVWLHADGQDHRQVLKMMPHLSHRNYTAVSISSPFGDGCTSWLQDPVCIERTAERIEVAINHAKLRLNVDPERVFIVGCGSGGTMAMRVAFAFPNWFAGVISLNGEVPQDGQPLGSWTRCRNLPIFWAHARRSNRFGECTLCQNLKLLHVAGFSLVLKQYPCGDSLDSQVFHDMNTWIMETISDSSHSNSIVR
ncbi:MAG TPA: hypothetical protein PKD64_10645 [Pirellulaceae bacterium]|nr:hypothetical protein [Pirellulaceae bacterium]HMO92639.1 hypothetical protein [Pirellulaceae bacterium]HMP70213.1 hypothetical protein [Pirellulaceae bacterium]